MNGKLNLLGKIVDAESEAAHISLDEYKFIEFWKGHGKK